MFVHARVPPKFKLSFYYFAALSLSHFARCALTLTHRLNVCVCVCCRLASCALSVTLWLSLLFCAQRKFCAFVIVSLFRTAFVSASSSATSQPVCLSHCLVASVAASTIFATSSSTSSSCFSAGLRWRGVWSTLTCSLSFSFYVLLLFACSVVASVSERDSLKKYATEKKRLSDPAN